MRGIAVHKALVYIVLLGALVFSCKTCAQVTEVSNTATNSLQRSAKDILGNPLYVAISYGGYRGTSRDKQPSVQEIQDDMKILHAMGVRIVRTYNVQLPHAANVLKAIRTIQKEDPSFEMYVMLGAWIDCKNAWTDKKPNHFLESDTNQAEIDRAVALAQEYPEIVKVLAVGNEAMVKWAESYYVQPSVILKWVRYLQSLKKEALLPANLWITSSDNFASWGGGGAEYHVPDLTELIKEVDFISLHTYPMHDTHYNPAFWGVPKAEKQQSKAVQIDAAMNRAVAYAKEQYSAVEKYVKSIGVHKPIHIGETGWASFSNGFYGNKGSKATDEYKAGLYYHKIRQWTQKEGITCFYFEAFDEQWKDANNPQGSENHFGLFTIDGQAKYALWKLVDHGVFKGLSRNGNPIVKTYKGSKKDLFKEVLVPVQVE